MENNENIENIVRSGKNDKKMLRLEKSQGDSFSANTRCLNFEFFSGGEHAPRPPKVFEHVFLRHNYVTKGTM